MLKLQKYVLVYLVELRRPKCINFFSERISTDCFALCGDIPSGWLWNKYYTSPMDDE